MTKNSVRALIREKRDKVSEETAIYSGERLLSYLKNFLRSQNWLLYASVQGEISTQPIFEFLRKSKRSCFFPRITGESIHFHRVDAWNELQTKSRIPEPSKDAEKFSGMSAIALIPGLAFTPAGHRLGFGKGYYDRFLSAQPKLFRIGLAYTFQIQFSAWKTEPHDQAMDSVITPGGIWASRR